MATITIKDSIAKKISPKDLEKLIHSNDFEDILFWYQMTQAETWSTQTLSSFKKSVWM